MTGELETQELAPERRSEIEQVGEQWAQELHASTGRAMEHLAPNGVLPSVPEEAAELLGVVRTIRKALAEVESLAESHLVNVLQENKLHVVVTPAHTYELAGGGKSKAWEGSKLVSDLIRLAEDQGMDVEHFGLLMMKLGGLDNRSHSWRMQQLAAIGLKPSEYCEYTPGRKRIEVS